jgi:hypothetical protein
LKGYHASAIAGAAAATGESKQSKRCEQEDGGYSRGFPEGGHKVSPNIN